MVDIPRITLDKKDDKSSVDSPDQVMNVHTVLLNALVEVLVDKGIISEEELVMKASTDGSKKLDK